MRQTSRYRSAMEALAMTRGFATAGILALLTLTPNPGRGLAAQQPGVGRITRIAQIIGPDEVVQVDTTTSLVQIRRGGGDWRSSRARQSLLVEDELMVLRFVDAQLDLEHGDQSGVLTFLPVLIRRDGRPVSGLYEDTGRPDTAAYVMRPDPSRRGDVAVEIERGSLVVEWNDGILSVFAAGDTIVIPSTRVAVTVLPGGDEAFVFVESGTVTIASQGLEVAAGEEAHLGRGMTPEKRGLERGEARAREYNDAVRYAHNEVWAGPKPFWAQPAFFIPAGALAVAGAAFVVADLGGDEGDDVLDGFVIIRIPF